MRRMRPIVLLSAVLALAGCGGDDSAGATGEGGTDGGAVGDALREATADGTTPSDASSDGTTDNAAPDAAPEAANDGGADTATAADGARDGGGDDGSGSNPGAVTCGTTECALEAGLVCCDTDMNDAGTHMCVPGGSGSACMGGQEQSCDEAANCPAASPANVCCLLIQPNGISADCMPSCVTALPRYQACKTDAECAAGTGPCTTYQCPSGETIRSCDKPPECQ
jgi:hypothetical protein